MNIPWLRFKSAVKGIWDPTIPYWPLIESGDSSSYFGTYEGQKYGNFETSCCWDFSATEIFETRLEMLWQMDLIPQDTKDWLVRYGYIDLDGDFYLSRRWVAILSGARDGGNDPINFWNIAKVAGMIPNKFLPYSVPEASKWISQNDFNNEYFNPQVITKEMEEMGKEFARRFKIMAVNMPGGNMVDINTLLQTYLKEGSMQICHPVPQDGSWNTTYVNYPTGRLRAEHATELYKFDPTQKYPYYDYDSYNPNLKQLGSNYLIPIITRVSIVPLSTAQPQSLSSWQMFWCNIVAWFTGKTLPFPSVPVGSANSAVLG